WDDRVLGQLRCLRPRGGGVGAVPRAGGPRDDRIPGARGRGKARSLPPPRSLANREHAEGPPAGGGVREGASRVAIGLRRRLRRLRTRGLCPCVLLRSTKSDGPPRGKWKA